MLSERQCALLNRVSHIRNFAEYLEREVLTGGISRNEYEKNMIEIEKQITAIEMEIEAYNNGNR